MRWIQLSIDTTSDGVAPLCALISELAFPGAEIVDERDFAEYLNDKEARWDYIDDVVFERVRGMSLVRVYIEEDGKAECRIGELKKALSDLKSRLGESAGSLAVSAVLMEDSDWENEWKKYFTPFPLGEGFYVRPSWSGANCPAGRKLISLDPGMAFGTGTHETTRLCVSELERHVSPGDRVLDLGCGSGILSIVAAILEASSVTAVDIDERAVDIAIENIVENSVADVVTASVCDILADEGPPSEILRGGRYDVVVANITADAVIAIFPRIPKLLSDGGVCIVSGIIDFRADEVEMAAAAGGFTELARRSDGDWRAYTYHVGGDL